MPDPSPSAFAATRWTLVLEAGGDGDSPKARAALQELCDIYYAPVVAFIRRRKAGSSDDEARDLAHGFFESVLEKGAVGGADPARGRFRNYLLGAVKHFLLEQRRREGTEKRGGGIRHQPLAGDEIAVGRAPDAARFDREWALALIGRALGQLETEMVTAGKPEQFTILKPWLDGNADTSQAEAAALLGLSGTAVKVAIHRLRERLRAKVRSEVAATLHDPAELDDELRHLVAALATA